MSLGYKDETGGFSFPGFDGPIRIPRNTTDAVDSSGNLYDKDYLGRIIIPRYRKDDDSSSVVTSANGFTGDVTWIGGNKIRVTNRDNQIKISFESDKTDDSPWDDSSDDCCKHPGDDAGGNSGGVDPSADDGSHGVDTGWHGGGGGGGGGGVPAGGGTHEGDTPCCGPR